MNIGAVFSGLFINTTDAPITVTFTITPVGPAPTYCTGIPVIATITVNPRPRVIPLMSQMCYGDKTNITLVSPSTMTKPNTIEFGYKTYRTSPLVGGYMGAMSNVSYGTVISNPYTNNTDTVQSVYYKVVPTVTSALGCPSGDSLSFEVKVHAKPLQNLIITEPLTCEGGSNADISAVTSRGAGGTTGYYFDWIRTQLDQVHGYNQENLYNRRGGRWDVTVTDNLNCKSSGFIFVSGAKLDSYMYVPVDPSSGYATTCTGSTDGKLWLMETNSSTGIAPFEYWVSWNGQDTASTDIHGTIVNKEEFKIWSDLPAGNYRLYIKDKNGCYNNTNPQIDIIEPPQITPTFKTKKYDGDFDISCKGYNDGSVWINTIEGGNGGYRYKWTTINGSITGIDTLDRLDNITAGTYYLHTTDIKGCTKIDSVRLYEPTGMVLSASQVSVKPDGTYNISCDGGSDGSIDITVTGGSGNYTYSWTGPAGFSSTSEDISGLKEGIYNCTVRDLNGCLLAPAPSFNLSAPPDITVSAVPSVSPDGRHNIKCYGETGSVNITVAGGIPGTYQYFWSTSDGSGIVQGQEDQIALTAGSYVLKVTDINGCEDSISVTLIQPERISLSFRERNITCASGVFNDGAINLTVTGGAAPYSYAWSNGSNSEDISGLVEGTYTVTVTDFNGCPMTGSARVVNPPPLTYNSVISNYNGYNISCFGMTNGSISITTTSGTPPYIFTWTGPDGFVATTPDISNLKAGTYILDITDSLACHTTETFELKEPGQLGMTLSMSSSLAGGYNINCAGDRTGYIGIEPLNSVKSVEYLWSDGLFGRTRYDLPAGEYSVIITDANNCYASTTVELTQPDSLKINFNVTQPFCPDMPNGSVIAEVTGGVPAADYYYKWSDNSLGKSLTDITAGFYSLTVRDLNGCVVKDSLFVDAQNESCLIIPNAISPNGDLINDEWHIENIDLYPEAEVKIFNRWGISVWKSAKGYPQPWDGRRSGKALPIDSYHYIIDLHNGKKPVIGAITIVR
jgi:gliding motility-associated-like protein